MHRAVRILRGLLIVATVTVCAAGVLVLGVLAIVQSDWGRSQLVELANGAMSTPGGVQVRIERITGELPASVEIHGITVGDRDGTWLELERASTRWHPGALLVGSLEVANLDLQGLTVLRRPVATGDSEPMAWPEMPLRIRIEHFALRDVVLEQPVIGDTVELEATGDTYIEGTDRIRTSVLVDRTDGVFGRARADVLIKPRSGIVKLDVALNEADGGLIARTMNIDGLPAVSVRIEGEGPLDAVRGHARMRAGDRLSVASDFVLDAVERPRLEVEGVARVAGLVEPPLRDLLADEVVFAARAAITDHGVTIEHAELSNDLAHALVSGALEERSADFEVRLELLNLASFAEMVGFALAGRASIQSHLRSDDIRRGVIADTRAIISEALPAATAFHALVGTEVEVSGTFELVTDNDGERVSIRDARVEGDAARLSAEAQLALDTGALEATGRLILPRLAVLSDSVGTLLGGVLEVDADVAGTLAEPTVALRLKSPDLSVDGVTVGAADGRLGVEPRGAASFGGDADISIHYPRIGPVSAASSFRVEADDTLRLDNLTVRTRDATLGGDLVVDTSSATVAGRLAGRALALDRWSDLVGRSLSGATDVTIEMRADGGRQIVDVSTESRDLTVAAEPGNALRIRTLRATAHLSDAFGRANGVIRANAERATFDAMRLSTLDVVIELEDAQPRSARLEARGDHYGPFELRASAGYRAEDNDGFTVEVGELAASFDALTITLDQPASLTHVGDTTTLSRTILSLADGHLGIEGRLDAERIDARLDVNGLALAALEPAIVTGGIQGTLSGYARIEGTRNSPSGSLEFEATEVHSGQKALAADVRASGRLQGEWRDGRAQLSARVAGLTPTDIEARASVPLELDARTLALSMPSEAAVGGELRWTGELGPVWDLLSPFEDRFTGSGDLSITLAGVVSAPRLSGYFRVSDGGYVNVLSGTTLTDVALNLVGDGEALVLESLSAGDGRQGGLEAGGTIKLQPAVDYPTDLDLKFNDFLLVARDDLILVGDGDLALVGTFTNLLLSGEIVTGQSELLLAGTLPPDVVELEVREVNVEDAATAKKRKRKDVGDPAILVLDVNLSVPGRAFVRGLGLDSEWKGDVKISGDATSPNLAGTLQPVRGNFSLLGKRFELERGEIRFTGSDEVDPLLNLTAERRTSNLTALVEVTGSASRPKVKLSSRPPLPESEIASQVLFGTDSASLSPAQSLQLASAIATYSGAGGAVGILDSTRRALGVDVIDLNESQVDPDSTRVSVGKYITDGVYLEVEGGTAEDARTSTTVEVEVLPDVRIEGGTTEKGGNKVGVKWHWDY